jgi:tetrachlorobenzoquinone reductase
MIAVKRERVGRGGSRYMHEALRVGTLVRVGQPRNNFPLAEDAAASVLIAGGIGITPILAMVERLAALGRPFQLHYAVKGRLEAAFMDRLGVHGSRVSLHVDAERGGLPDLARIVAGAAPEAHLYCCGPEPMLQAFERATSTWPQAQLHLERFTVAEMPPAAGGFTVELRRSGRQIMVPPGQSILDAVRAAGIQARASCEQGVCGSCETRVLSGIPDHRDMILSEAEKAKGEFMMICCSGCQSGPLVLDL